MNEYKIKLEMFEGPLDLLMHLIEKNELDINDIPIAQVTEQYLEYLRALEEYNIDIASEFLVMAATLLQIKSRVLLPRPVVALEEQEPEDLQQELIARLLEYRKFKRLAAVLESKGIERLRFYTRQPIHIPTKVVVPWGLSIEDLMAAFAAVIQSSESSFAIIEHEEYSIQDKIEDIIILLRRNNGKLEFKKTIIRSGTRTEVITAFLALLELIRQKKVSIEQHYNFGPIYLNLKG